MHRRCRGAYAIVAMIAGYGLLAFRDPYGIRPLIIGVNESMGGTEYLVACESVALEALGFKVLRDVAPGEAIYIDQDGNFHAGSAPSTRSSIRASSSSSIWRGPTRSSTASRSTRRGCAWAASWREKIADDPRGQDIDVVIPIPDSSRPSALELAKHLG